MKVRCHITVKDIREATSLIEHNTSTVVSTCCPTARAVNRKLKSGYYSLATRTYIAIVSGGNTAPHNIGTKIPLSSNMEKWIHAYDMNRRTHHGGERARPTNFTIDIPSMYVRETN